MAHPRGGCREYITRSTRPTSSSGVARSSASTSAIVRNRTSRASRLDGRSASFGGGPFSGAYGNSGAPGMFGQQLWNTRVVLSTVVGPGTALVGNFALGAHIWRRGGVTVEATNSHPDYFVRNLSMLRAEERLGLGVYRPAAFTEVRGLA